MSKYTLKRKRMRNNVRQKVDLYKLENNVCFLCGQKFEIDDLEFHHKNPSLKEFDVTKRLCKGWTQVKLEIDKCVLVCDCCHRFIHKSNKEGGLLCQQKK